MADLFAYVDETGDPGSASKSSQAFGMAAIIMGSVGVSAARSLADELKREFSIPAHKPLSWKDHVREHDRRRFVSRKLAELPDLVVTYNYCRKSEVNYGNFVKDRGMFYNYVAGKTYKSILWTARYWPNGDSRNTVKTSFGHVRGFDHEATTLPYFKIAVDADPKVPNQLERKLAWVDGRKYRESMIADLFAGCLHSAITDDRYGSPEGSYLLNVWPQIRNSGRCAIPLGLMSIPQNSLVTKFDWFPCSTCTKKPGNP